VSALAADVGAELAAAAEWHLLALLFSRPTPGWREEVEAVAAEAGEPLKQAAAAARQATEGAYHALLGAGGRASPREAAHAGFQDPGRILADLAARYGAFGFAPAAEEADDHLSVECDFVAYLYLKEAYARAQGATDPAEVTREARQQFLDDHLVLAGHGLAEKLPPDAPDYLILAAQVLRARLPAPRPLPAGCGPSCDPLEGGCPGLAQA
jgi:nitrate reductase assembly molybdenum cofactor insertion protein NarJ